MSLDTLEIDDITIEICQDYDPENPREWENLGTMICWHKQYNLGDSNTDYSLNDYNSAEELFDAIKKDSLVVLPLYLYDHSGISMSVGSFVGRAPHAEWDSGMVGYIYATKEAIKAEGVDIATAEEILRKEVEIYDKYLQGDFYGYTAYKNTKCDCCGHTSKEVIDSCWGYGSVEEAMNAGKDAIA